MLIFRFIICDLLELLVIIHILVIIKVDPINWIVELFITEIVKILITVQLIFPYIFCYTIDRCFFNCELTSCSRIIFSILNIECNFFTFLIVIYIAIPKFSSFRILNLRNPYFVLIII